MLLTGRLVENDEALQAAFSPRCTSTLMIDGSMQATMRMLWIDFGRSSIIPGLNSSHPLAVKEQEQLGASLSELQL